MRTLPAARSGSKKSRTIERVLPQSPDAGWDAFSDRDLESFAYRRGVPADADFVFDARALPNPHWDARLRPLSGRDAAVREHLDADPLAARFRDAACGFIGEWLPRFESETRSYLTVAFGCTGGRHRSVWLAESLAAALRAAGRDDVHTFHREIE